MSTHTPTPWELAGTGHTIINGAKGLTVVVLDPHMSVTDAHYIVRAVNLHEKVVEALHDTCSLLANADEDYEPCPEYRKARALLAQAQEE